jgi:hypothetical protein
VASCAPRPRSHRRRPRGKQGSDQTMSARTPAGRLVSAFGDPAAMSVLYSPDIQWSRSASLTHFPQAHRWQGGGRRVQPEDLARGLPSRLRDRDPRRSRRRRVQRSAVQLPCPPRPIRRRLRERVHALCSFGTRRHLRRVRGTRHCGIARRDEETTHRQQLSAGQTLHRRLRSLARSLATS